MTQEPLSEYRAHRELVKWKGLVNTKELRDYLKSLQFEYAQLETRLQSAEKLCGAIIVLPDDAEPEVGDLVSGMYKISKGDEYFIYSGPCPYNSMKIIQRNGQPVIYESTLQHREEK